MREQVARFGDDGWVAIERSVSFPGCFDGGVVLRRYVRHRKPLRFTIDARKRLISGVRQLKETIGAFLNRRRGTDAPNQEYGYE